MTRDEAIEKLWVPSPPQSWALSKDNAAEMVDRLVALGLLKLDEPKTVLSKVYDLMGNALVAQGGHQERYVHFCELLERCGLKIVEK